MVSESSAQAGSPTCDLVQMPFSQGGGGPQLLQCDRVQYCVRARLSQHNVSPGTASDTSGQETRGVKGGWGITVNYQSPANLLTHQDFVDSQEQKSPTLRLISNFRSSTLSLTSSSKGHQSVSSSKTNTATENISF